jgi:hypothetical protein
MQAESFEGFGWIKVPRYVMDESKSWQERYRELEHHHIQETTFLIAKVRELAAANLRSSVASASADSTK